MTQLNEAEVIAPDEYIHGCIECAEVLKGYVEDDEGCRHCKECGGQVLNLQQAFDYIKELEWRLRELE